MKTIKTHPLLPALALFLVAASTTGAAADTWDDVRAAVYYHRTGEVERLLASGVDVNIRSTEGYTPLMIAADQNDAAMVRFLLARGADPGLRSGLGRTAREMTTSSEVKALLGSPNTAASPPVARPAAPRAPTADTKEPARAADDHCRIMYGKSLKLCGSSDYSCKIKAHQGYANCRKTGTWF